MKIGAIEKNIKIPEVHSRVKYPWPTMKVGDSVFIQPSEGEPLALLKRKVGPSSGYYGEITDKTFKSRIDHSKGGVLVWRTK